MDLHTIALMAAGAIGSVTAVVHGVLTERLMVPPIDSALLKDKRSGRVIRQLVPMLLHYSTVSWFLSGVLLIVAALWFPPDAKLATALIVGGHFLYGAIGNAWATRGRHPGWMLMAVAVGLIAYGLSH
ncbi:hypothetical protein sos41_35770 [Alphaproteobacteria bacterium SO-S41]|nr:hypothetical protein sos41_35770 [Alphaproteobacteria bacterium SO-S41]